MTYISINFSKQTCVNFSREYNVRISTLHSARYYPSYSFIDCMCLSWKREIIFWTTSSMSLCWLRLRQMWRALSQNTTRRSGRYNFLSSHSHWWFTNNSFSHRYSERLIHLLYFCLNMVCTRRPKTRSFFLQREKSLISR